MTANANCNDIIDTNFEMQIDHFLMKLNMTKDRKLISLNANLVTPLF